MTYDPKKHHRRSIRLDGYDYAQAGAYFVTICTAGRRCLFGQIQNDSMQLNEYGRLVHEAWCNLPDHYPHVALDAFVVMPNHVHMIILLADVGAGPIQADSVQAGFKPAPTARRHALAEIIRAFKTFSARRINESSELHGTSLWHRNYFEHIIRNDVALARIRQ